jgi:antitoxin HicB
LDNMDKTIDYYMGLPYTIEMVPGLESGWVVSIRELSGCISQGDSPQNAVDMIREAMCGWLEIALEDGLPIPEPRELEEYSGRFVVRVPRWLHRELARTSGQEGVSLNQFVSTALARAVGEYTPPPARPTARQSASTETTARLDAVRTASAALIAALKLERGEDARTMQLAEDIRRHLEPDPSGAAVPDARQRAVTPRRDRSQKGSLKSGVPASGSQYVISPQAGTVCLADGDAVDPPMGAASHG